MLVYANGPVISTSDAIAILKRRSEDPLVQVVCLAIDTSTGLLIGYGVNKIIKNIPKSNLVYSTVGADKHPAKNFLMFHAEMDLVFKFHDMSEEQKRRTKIYASLQPCLNCLKTLINFGFTDVEWMTDNRHQDDQKMIEPYTHLIKYKKNEEGYAVQIPRWIVHEEEIEKHFRDHRQPKDEEVL